MIDWQLTDVTELPLLADVPVDEIEMLVASGETPVMDFSRSPVTPRQLSDVSS